jgi:hypothetical protein
VNGGFGLVGVVITEKQTRALTSLGFSMDDEIKKNTDSELSLFSFHSSSHDKLGNNISALPWSQSQFYSMNRNTSSSNLDKL